MDKLKKEIKKYKTCAKVMKVLAIITAVLLLVLAIAFPPVIIVAVLAFLLEWKVVAKAWEKKAAELQAELDQAQARTEELAKRRAEYAEAERIRAEKAKEREAERIRQEKEFKQKLATVPREKTICVDVETTGFDAFGRDEILQLSIIDGNNKVLFNEYIKPKHRRKWDDAEKVHGISFDTIRDKKHLEDHLEVLDKIFKEAELLVGYNIAGFDIDFLKEGGIDVPKELPVYDVMLEFAPIYGEWNSYHGDYKWQKLITCAKHYGYTPEGDWHDSLTDVKATLYCFYKMIGR